MIKVFYMMVILLGSNVWKSPINIVQFGPFETYEQCVEATVAFHFSQERLFTKCVEGVMPAGSILWDR